MASKYIVVSAGYGEWSHKAFGRKTGKKPRHAQAFWSRREAELAAMMYDLGEYVGVYRRLPNGAGWAECWGIGGHQHEYDWPSRI